MYQEFYGLRERPFELTANPRFLFLTSKQREALSNLQYGLMSVKSLTLLVGDAGTGKTTLIQAALASERCRNVRCVYLNNPMLSQADFVNLLAQRFDLGAEAASSKAVLLDRLEASLRKRREAGETTALVVDEAQSLSTELLEEVRLLANIETPTEKLLPLVLAGQPELSDRLEHPDLRQLKQRVALRCDLLPFELGDTAAYIASRIRTAGGVPSEMFSLEAVTLVNKLSRGIPRTINVICDNALVGGMALGRRRVDQTLVAEVCRDLHLSGATVERSDASEASGRPPAADADPVQTPDANSGAVESAEAPPDRFRFGFRWRSATSTARIITE